MLTDLLYVKVTFMLKFQSSDRVQLIRELFVYYSAYRDTCKCKTWLKSTTSACGANLRLYVSVKWHRFLEIINYLYKSADFGSLEYKVVHRDKINFNWGK